MIAQFLGGPQDGAELQIPDGLEALTIVVADDDEPGIRGLSELPDDAVGVEQFEVPVVVRHGKAFLVWPAGRS